MPYIKTRDRQDFEPELTNMVAPQCAGELNYLFTQIANKFLANKGVSYQTFNDIIGALEGAKLELYRRQIAPYENQKIQENGDVFPVG